MEFLVGKGLKALLTVLNAVGGIRVNNNRHLRVEEETIFGETKALTRDGNLEEADLRSKDFPLGKGFRGSEPIMIDD